MTPKSAEWTLLPVAAIVRLPPFLPDLAAAAFV
jgi:hypothetical protein